MDACPVFLIESEGSIVMVVSPLSALMKDQVETFRKEGVTSAFVTSDSTDKECVKMKDDVIQGKCQLVYISPEQLIGNLKFHTMCQSDSL